MVKHYLILITTLLCINGVYLRKVIIETVGGLQGYYWRDLINDTPEDAIRGGIDSKGAITYIGQTVHYKGGGSLLTGPYIPKEKHLYYEYGSQQLVVSKWIKILCSQEPENFEWISVRSGEDVNRGNALSYVHGGDDTDRTLGIGRIKIDGQVVVGKVLILDNVFSNFFYNWKGTGTSSPQYEALYYRKNINTDCSVIDLQMNPLALRCTKI